MKKTVLVFGISSFVGSNLAQLLGNDFRIIGTYYQTPVEIPGVLCVPCDVLKKDYVTKLTAIFKPHFTIYAIGLSSLTECKYFPKKADALNSAGASNCLMASERYGSKFIYFSSSYVLGGEDVIYGEGDTPFPNSIYGSTLSSTEFYIQRSCLNYLILRCAPLYGRSFNPQHPNWFETVQAAFAQGQSLAADDSVQTGFIDIFILSKILKALLEMDIANRLLQVSSKDFMTRYEFAKLYAKIFKEDENLIRPTSGNFPVDTDSKKIGTQKVVSRNYYFKMDTSNLEEVLGVEMPKIEDSLNLTFKRLSLAP